MKTTLQLFHNLIPFDQPLSLITSIGTLVSWILFLAYFVIKSWTRNRRREKLLKFTPSSKGSVAVSIGVGVIPQKDVENFLSENFPDVPLVMKYSKMGDFSSEQLLQIFDEIKSDFFDLMQRGDIKEILLFYGGPLTLMAPIGAIVDNWVPVRLFGRTKDMKYVFHFTLDRQLIKGIPPKHREK
ncbi:MAG: hypothetical protein ABH886_07125 [Candidatus Desantisbacteria bacterium]